MARPVPARPAVALDRRLIAPQARRPEGARADRLDDGVWGLRLPLPYRNSHNLRRRLRPAVRAAGVPWVTPHVLRHSLATELLDNGHDTSAVAKVLGHRSEAFTRRSSATLHPRPRDAALRRPRYLIRKRRRAVSGMY